MNLAYVAARVADTMRTADLVYLADHDQQSKAVAAAVGALVFAGFVYFVPPAASAST